MQYRLLAVSGENPLRSCWLLATSIHSIGYVVLPVQCRGVIHNVDERR